MAKSNKDKTIADALQHCLDEQEPKKKLLPIEMANLAYAALTLLLTFVLWRGIDAPVLRIVERLAIIGMTFLLWFFSQKKPCPLTRFVRNIFPVLLITFWYPDIFHYCSVFPNMDHIIALAEQTLFDYQPSQEFFKTMPEKFWSELFYMGYFSYYVMIVLGIVMPLTISRRLFEKTAFIIIASFLLYYVIFLFMPVAGPQYYFEYVNLAEIKMDYYPPLNDFFRTHIELNNSVGEPGFFHSLVDIMQRAGERPIAAFPSSHVGIGTILMIVFFKHFRRLSYFLMPFYILLCFSTVYIQAHYLIDVYAGLFTAPLFYIITRFIYKRLHVKEKHHSHHQSSHK